MELDPYGCRSRARSLDQFYTRVEVAEACVAEVRRVVDGTALWVEPAAGDGAFLRLLPEPRVGLDVAPADPSVVQADFLAWRPASADRSIIVVGNPPFGKNASLAVRFFNHAAEFASVVAFIVPRTFQKLSTQLRLAAHMALVSEMPIGPESFRFDGRSYDVPTVFQVWRRGPLGLVRGDRPARVHPDFSFRRTPGEADFAFQRVGARAGLVSVEGLRKSPQSHYFIRAETGAVDVREVLHGIDWSDVKHRTAGNPSIGRAELVQAYVEAISPGLRPLRR